MKKRKWSYPEARKGDAVDDYHGTEVPDPYRWLEDADSAETAAWVAAENKATRAFLDAVPARRAIEARLRELWDYHRYGVPRERGGRYFFSKNDGLQNQPVLYVAEELGGEPKALLDPNALSDDGTVALTDASFTDDGARMAYALSAGGSDWQEVRIRDTATGKDSAEVLKWTKFAGLAWTKDGKSLFYNRLPEPGTVPPEDQHNFSRVWRHAAGTPQADDELVFEMPERKELGFRPFVTEDGAYLALYVYHGTDSRNGIYLRPTGGGEFLRLFDVERAKYVPVGSEGTTFYFWTDDGAPKGRVIAVDIAAPGRDAWKEIVPEGADAVHEAHLFGGRLVVKYLHDAYEILKVYSRDGRFVRDITLPAMGAVEALSGRMEAAELFFSFSSFIHPPAVYRHDLATGETACIHESPVPFDASAYKTRQVFFTSKDGTRVPMFLTHTKDLARNGGNPVYLRGYGGFNIAVTPVFSPSVLAWLERGGVFAVANLRGGGEYGEEWHAAGMLDKKQNVFDDFFAAADYLIAEKYTAKEKLAIGGGSNGGLLVTACMTQRPELYGAVVAQVPVTDMLRYHRFTVGRYWTPEYGNAEENAAHFKFLYAYSPLHTIREGAAHPPTLVATADTDDRVVPLHAKKFVAALQEKDAGANPVLLRIETKAGHGLGKPTVKLIAEQADIWAFLCEVLGVEG